jgi:hypothetical protein
MRIKALRNGKAVKTIGLKNDGRLYASLCLSKGQNEIWLHGTDSKELFDWGKITLQEGDSIVLQLLRNGRFDPSKRTSRPDQSKNTHIENKLLARKILRLTNNFFNDLAETMKKAKRVERSAPYAKYKSEISYVWDEIYKRVEAPIYRKHKALIPKQLKEFYK